MTAPQFEGLSRLDQHRLVKAAVKARFDDGDDPRALGEDRAARIATLCPMADAELKQKVEELIAANPVLLFMKGTPDMPRCGFSMRVVQVLDSIDVEYGAIDVLPALQPLREVTAEISDWQTFPQLYVNGELIGGADIVEEMFESGELAEALGVEQPAAAPAPRQPRRRRSRRPCRSNSGAPRARRPLSRRGVLFHLERGPAAAGGDDVRVVDLEARALQAFHVVDLGAEDELHADLVDDHRDAVDLEDVVVVLDAIEGERVLEARAAAAADGDAKRLALGVLLGAEQLADLAGRLLGEGDGCLRSLGLGRRSLHKV